jgi:tetratricopeptide (TPR) repeat protein
MSKSDEQSPPPTGSDAEKKRSLEELTQDAGRIEALITGKMNFQEFIDVTNESMFLMATIGHQMFEQARYNDAEIIFRGLCTLNPKESYFTTALGAIYLIQEQLEPALMAFNSSIRVNEKDVPALVNRGEIRLRQGKFADAAEDFRAAEKLDPEGKTPMVQRARALARAAIEMLGPNAKQGPTQKAKRKGPEAPKTNRSVLNSGKAKTAPPRTQTGDSAAVKGEPSAPRPRPSSVKPPRASAPKKK